MCGPAEAAKPRWQSDVGTGSDVLCYEADPKLMQVKSELVETLEDQYEAVERPRSSESQKICGDTTTGALWP